MCVDRTDLQPRLTDEIQTPNGHIELVSTNERLTWEHGGVLVHQETVAYVYRKNDRLSETHAEVLGNYEDHLIILSGLIKLVDPVTFLNINGNLADGLQLEPRHE